MPRHPEGPTYHGSAIITNGDVSQHANFLEYREIPTKPSGKKASLETATTDEEDEMKHPSKGGYPRRTPLVLTTLRPGTKSEEEYRVGIVEDKDFIEGLCCLNLQQRRLNPIIARRCFGSSPIFFDKDEAIVHAQTLRASIGVKVLQYHEVWPGTECKIISLR